MQIRRVFLRTLVAVAPGMPCALIPAVAAQPEAVLLERRVKAAFLYKFISYIAWPEDSFTLPDSPVVIGVLGDDLLMAELGEAVAGRSVEGRPVLIRRLREPDSLTGIHVLFVAAAENTRLPLLVRATANQAVLVVSEAEGALAQGSMINFVMTSGRVKFEIAPDTAEKRGIKLSSRLLTVAQSVRTGSAP